MNAHYVKKKSEELGRWLAANGAQVLEPTSEWELVRFKAGDTTSVIYRNSRGEITFTGAAEEAFKAFKHGKPWRAAPATKRSKVSVHIRTLRNRDGSLCFFCQEFVSDSDASAEHLVSVTHRGPNHISNLFLSHRSCNARAGSLSAPEKIRVHVNAILSKLKGVSNAENISKGTEEGRPVECEVSSGTGG